MGEGGTGVGVGAGVDVGTGVGIATGVAADWLAVVPVGMAVGVSIGDGAVVAIGGTVGAAVAVGMGVAVGDAGLVLEQPITNAMIAPTSAVLMIVCSKRSSLRMVVGRLRITYDRIRQDAILCAKRCLPSERAEVDAIPTSSPPLRQREA